MSLKKDFSSCMETPARQREIKKSLTKSRSPACLICCCSGKRREWLWPREQCVPLMRASQGMGWEKRQRGGRSLLVPAVHTISRGLPLVTVYGSGRCWPRPWTWICGLLEPSGVSRQWPSLTPARPGGAAQKPEGSRHPRGGWEPDKPLPASGGQQHTCLQVGLAGRRGPAGLWRGWELLLHPGWRPAGRRAAASELTP